MTKFKKLTDYLQKNRWIFATFLYVTLCVWIFFTTKVEVEGYQLDQTSAGFISLAVWHFMLLLAFACAWLLHKAVELISRIKKK